jgi:hypothetical protein
MHDRFDPLTSATARMVPRFAIALALLACAGSGGPSAPDDGDGPAPEPRTYAMGFAPTPPYATIESIVETGQSIAQRGELVLIQQEVPWGPLLDGTQTMEEAVEERVRLEEFVRGLGLEVVFLLDPLDGLDRRREPPDLVARGRSIVEPEIRALHDAWALEMARVFRPNWYGLASEVNTLADLGDPALHAAVRAMINDLSPRVKAASPGTRTFVSFQADQAYGLPGFPRTIDHFALIDDYAVDALGLSTYPVFVLDDPSQIPDDFFARFDQATARPLLLVEGGWSSEIAGGTNGTPAEQADFFRRMAALLDGVRAEAWVFLLYTDLDLASWGLPPDREAGLANFSRMGIVDVDFRPKPAAAVWDSVRARPLSD